LFSAASYAELYSPEIWYSFRTDTLRFSAGVSDADSGKTVHYELLQKNEEGRTSVLFSKSKRATENEWVLEFSGIKRDVVGRNALWVKETIGNDTQSKMYGPYGFIRTRLLESSDTANAYLGDIKNFSLNVDETFNFAYNRNGLIIALNDSKGNLTVSLDPANSKTAFLAFANRIIIFDAEDKSVSFYYPERSVDGKTSAIQYRIRDWEGDMKVFDTANGKVLFIPWYDLGMLYESGRRFGFMVHGDNFLYPAKASHHSPSTWGNIILK
jgi:hypothetical protein